MVDEHILAGTLRVLPPISLLNCPPWQWTCLQLVSHPHTPTSPSSPMMSVQAAERKKTRLVLMTSQWITGPRQPALMRIRPLTSPLKHLATKPPRRHWRQAYTCQKKMNKVSMACRVTRTRLTWNEGAYSCHIKTVL